MDRSVQGRNVQTGCTALIEAPTHEIQNTESRPDHNTGNFMPYSFSDKCVGSLTSPANHVTLKMQETGPAGPSPYPTRLERLTICRCHYKGKHITKAAHSPQLFKDPECWSGRGFEPAISRTAVRCTTSSANR